MYNSLDYNYIINLILILKQYNYNDIANNIIIILNEYIYLIFNSISKYK